MNSRIHWYEPYAIHLNFPFYLFGAHGPIWGKSNAFMYTVLLSFIVFGLYNKFLVTSCALSSHVHQGCVNGSLARYVKLWVRLRLECRECFLHHGPGERSRHASRHVRHVRTVMHAGIAKLWFPLKSAAGENVPVFPTHAQPAILCIL